MSFLESSLWIEGCSGSNLGSAAQEYALGATTDGLLN